MAKADIKAGAAYVTLFVKGSALTKGLAKASQELQDFGSGIVGIGASVFAMGSVITGSLTGAVMHFANVGSALNDMSARTGMSTTALVELGHAADMTGTDMDTVEKAIGKMQKQIGGAGPESKKLAETLSRVGLSVADLSGMEPDKQFSKIAGAIAEISDPAEKTATAMEIFGRSGSELLPMINDLAALRKEAQDLGLAPSPESIQAADDIGDAIDRVRKVASAAFFEIGASVAPMVQDLLTGFLQVASSVKEFITENRAMIAVAAKVGVVLAIVGSGIIAVGAGFITAGLVINGVLAVVTAFGLSLSLASTILGAVGAGIALILSPIGLLGVALAAGVIAWARFTQSGQNAVGTLVSSATTLFDNLRQTVTDTFGGIVEAIRAGDLSLAGQIAMVGLRLVFAQGLESIRGLFGDTIGALVAQILSGDLLGAWRTLGSTMLATWAGIGKSIVNIFTEVMRSIDTALDGRISKISKALALIQGGEGAIIGEAFSSLIPDKKANDPFNAALDAIDAAAQFTTDATDAAVQDAIGGTAIGTSKQIQDLKAELDALRQQATEKVASGRIGDPSEDEIDGYGSDNTSAGMKGRASIASNNLAALASLASAPQDRMERLQNQQLKKADKQIGKLDEVILAIDNLGLFHA